MLGMGPVLTLNQNVLEVVIAYASSSEKKYIVAKFECIAVLFAVQKFRLYIDWLHFTVIIDHFYLLWLNQLKNLVGKYISAV